jgi:hypothetical protein
MPNSFHGVRDFIDLRGSRRVGFVDRFVITLKVFSLARKSTPLFIDAEIVAGIDDIESLVSVFRRGDDGSLLDLKSVYDDWDAAITGHVFS